MGDIYVRPTDHDRTEVIIGADPECDIVVDDGYVSKRHAKIVRAVGRNLVNGCPGVCEIYDLGSINGTWIRRRPDLMLRVELGSFITLQPGDVIQVGKTRLPEWTGAVDHLP